MAGFWNRLLNKFSTAPPALSKFAQPQDEPLFIAIRNDDPEMQAAYAHAAATVDSFLEEVQVNDRRSCCAKLRFRDPDESERLGEDRFLYLWLAAVAYHPERHAFSGVFFEVPEPFTKWHQVGQRIGFEKDELFDWMVLENGHLKGGFTLRVARKNLPSDQRASYDEFIGVKIYEPLPSSARPGPPN